MTNKRILIFNVNWLGDVLFSTAAIRNIRYNYPDSYIACAVPARCYPVLKANPNLDEIIIFDEKDRHKSMISKLRFARELRAKRFDIVFLLHRSFTRALITYLAGIPERIGFYNKKRGFLLTRKVIAPKIDSLHRVDYYLALPRGAGLKIEDRFTEFFVEEKDISYVDNFLLREGVGRDNFLVVLNPGGNWGPKRWPKENFSALVSALVREPNTKVIITGGQEDIALANEISAAFKNEVVVATGMLNLKQLGALIKKADVFVSADSGPLHIANAVAAKNIIALFGPTSVRITGPRIVSGVNVIQKDTGCEIPCYDVDCADNRCMKEISVEEVLEKIRLIRNKS